MASPTLTNKELATQYGKRGKGRPIDEPQELGYGCPKGHRLDHITWSEFNGHIWCYKCQIDYPSKDCPIQRPCFMSDEQWNGFIQRLPFKATVIDGVQHFPDCETPP